jgi:hypothetical protein
MNKEAFDRAMSYSQKMMPECMDITKEHFNVKAVAEAPPWEDMKNATDLQVKIDGKIIRLAVRVRKDKPDKEYRDLTLRLYIPPGHKTEYEKLLTMENPPEYYLLAFGDENRLKEYAIIDIHKMIRSGLLQKNIEPDEEQHYKGKAVRVNSYDGNIFTCISLWDLTKAGCVVKREKIH